MNSKHLNKFQKPISIMLSFSILFILSCTVENSITTSTNERTLNKPDDIYSSDWELLLSDFGEWLGKYYKNDLGRGISSKVLRLAPGPSSAITALCFVSYIILTPSPKNISEHDLSDAYNFRDSFLINSPKGKSFIASYYLLSWFGIENNLVMKYPIEHISIMELGIEISKELQYGSNNNKILINHSTYSDLKNLAKVYRSSENHKDIEPVLDYLEADLEKYINKPKAEIAADFGF